MRNFDAREDATGQAVSAGTSLLDQIVLETKLKPADEGYDVVRKGAAAFIAGLLKPEADGSRANGAALEAMIAEVDRKLSVQVDRILHHDHFQALESAWRSLQFVVGRTDFDQNIKIAMMSVSKDELLEDFEDSPEVIKSGLYQHVYVAEYGQFGGQPVGAIIANYDFGPKSADVKLAQYCASVGAMSHAPFIAAAAPSMFGMASFAEMTGLKDMESIFEGPDYAKWNGFRETEEARYFALALPRFMLRTPYGSETSPVKGFNYEEEANGKSENYLWGNASFALATKLIESFAKFRLCANIVGPQSGGAVENLPAHPAKTPMEVPVSDRRELELADLGFISLTMRKGSDNAAFFSANSVQKPKVFDTTAADEDTEQAQVHGSRYRHGTYSRNGTRYRTGTHRTYAHHTMPAHFGKEAKRKDVELTHRLCTQLPYLMIVNRLAHYIKVMQRETIGSWKNRGELESELNAWIRQYVSDQENPSTEIRARRPLRKAEIVVSEVEGEQGWFSVAMAVQPHFKHMGADFTLSLRGKLDKWKSRAHWKGRTFNGHREGELTSFAEKQVA